MESRVLYIYVISDLNKVIKWIEEGKVDRLEYDKNNNYIKVWGRGII